MQIEQNNNHAQIMHKIQRRRSFGKSFPIVRGLVGKVSCNWPLYCTR